MIIGSSNIIYFEAITSSANQAQTLSYEKLFSGVNVTSITQVSNTTLGIFTFFITNNNLYIAVMDWDWDYLHFGSATSAADLGTAYSNLSVSYNIINF